LFFDRFREALSRLPDGLVRVLAYLVANPGAPASWGVAVARRLEEHDPRTVTSKLLGNLA